ncbi:MAG: 3-keto-5-aminohexanoate cleavage protein [Ruthenibacterium lactatiformans]|uniref:3-keto-5-aminohexanoate cleavage protein n=1 Tax=Ruthenibacterium lactatiformans TaxID=1550024 RepID=UPI003995FD9F
MLKKPLPLPDRAGCAGGMTSTVENLAYLKNLLPEGSTWARRGISSGHLPIMMATIAMGGHLRVGLEDNLHSDHGVLAKSNAQLVERAVQLLALNNLEPATPEEARKIYGLTRKVF